MGIGSPKPSYLVYNHLIASFLAVILWLLQGGPIEALKKISIGRLLYIEVVFNATS